jgi:hypothetical protein
VNIRAVMKGAGSSETTLQYTVSKGSGTLTERSEVASSRAAARKYRDVQISHGTLASYKKDPAVQTPRWLTSLSFFVAFLSLSSQTPGYYPKLDHDRFLPHPLQFILH